jgi:Cu(I)/Ag(I) efflux system membrane fusion protein
MIVARTKIFIGLIIAIAVVGAAFPLLRDKPPAAETSAERKVLYWYDPMQPNQHFDRPGKSPFMDMQLVPKYAEQNSAGAAAASGIKIDAATQRNLAIRAAPVERKAMGGDITVPGTIVFDERDLLVLQARANGFVQRVYVHAVGDRVQRNTPLVDLLIPEWAGVQQQLIALKNNGDAQLLNAVRQRALAAGMTTEQIAAIEKSGSVSPIFTVRAVQPGIVKTLDVREGMNIATATTLLTLNGIERVWFDMAVSEQQALTIKLDQKITIQLNGNEASAKIVAMLPELNGATRSVRVRAELDNKNGELRIGQYAQAKIINSETIAILTIPTEAVIRGGESNRVIVVQNDGSFAPVQVAIGREAGDRVEIVSGLSEGQRVVSSGQFLIDSEASLGGEMTRMPAPASAAQGAHQHD